MYGKLPVRGDFVSRRLKAGFVETWDKWLQSALSASKEQLGSQWLDIYLTSPIWHFVLSPGICGSLSWTGILMPSVDNVGRYFPLTFAVPMDSHRILPEIFMDTTDWFARMEQLALSALEKNLDLDELDRKLQAQALPEASVFDASMDDLPGDRNGKGPLALHVPMDTLDQMTGAFAQLGFHLLAHSHPTYSLWRTTGSASMNPCLRVYGHLPPVDAYSDLLIGRQALGASDTKSENLPLSADPGRSPDHSPDRSPDRSPDWAEASDYATMGRQPIQWQSYAGTTIGKKRKINEDAYLERPEIGLWAVADGMGGHSSGDVASKAVIDGLLALAATGNLESYTAYTTQCLRSVNADLIQMAGESDGRSIIGTTVVVMLAVGMRCAAIWAGDSRLYQLRDGQLTQLTCDHALPAEFSKKEESAAEERNTRQMGNVVTRAMGVDAELSFDVVSFEAREGDLYLLCSDGLIKEVKHQEIAGIMGQGRCRTIAEDLIELSLERGARDNVTVVVARAGRLSLTLEC
jgi:type VI secretion system protein ImpM